jgi:rRNA-processing protein FCF1
MKVADLTLEQFKLFIKEAVYEALEEQGTQTETKVWLEASAQDLVKGLRIAEADVSEDELEDWLETIEKAVKPLDAILV